MRTLVPDVSPHGRLQRVRVAIVLDRLRGQSVGRGGRMSRSELSHALVFRTTLMLTPRQTHFRRLPIV